jgi:uncharacterized protein YgiM (DUF1202 family)
MIFPFKIYGDDIMKFIFLLLICVLINSNAFSADSDKWDDFPEWIMSADDFSNSEKLKNTSDTSFNSESVNQSGSADQTNGVLHSSDALLNERRAILQRIENEKTQIKKNNGMPNSSIKPGNDFSKNMIPRSSDEFKDSDEFKGEDSEKLIGVIIGSGVNCRNGASLYEPVIYQFRQGSYVPLIDYKKGWYKVAIEEKIQGWIFNKYLKTKVIERPVDLNELTDFFVSSQIDQILIEKFNSGLSSLTIGYIQGNKVNVRSGPGIDEPFVTKGFDNDIVIVSQEKNNWYNISWLLPRTGWIHESLIKDINQIKGKVLTNGADIKSGPGDDYDLVRRVLKNMEIPVIGVKDSWFLVALPTGQTGYISSSCFSPPESLKEKKK